MHLRIGLVVLCLLNFSDLSGFSCFGIFIFIECEAHLFELIIALDIDLPSADSCSKSYILTFTSDCKRQLLFRYDCCSSLFVLVDINTLNDCRSQHIADQTVQAIAERDGIFVILTVEGGFQRYFHRGVSDWNRALIFWFTLGM